MDSSQPAPLRETKRWLMFLLKPDQLLQLLRVISQPTNLFAAGTLPPDVAPVDTFYDERKNFLGMMLQSEFFEPVEVEMRGAQMAAAWPRAIFTLEAQPDTGAEIDRDELWGDPMEEGGERPDDPQTPFGELIDGIAARGFQVRAFNFSAADLLLILRTESPAQLPIFPIYPEDTRIVNIIANAQIGGWTLFLEHPDFESAKLSQGEGEVVVDLPSDGHEMQFRFGLPGATLQRKIGLDVDEL